MSPSLKVGFVETLDIDGVDGERDATNMKTVGEIFVGHRQDLGKNSGNFVIKARATRNMAIKMGSVVMERTVELKQYDH